MPGHLVHVKLKNAQKNRNIKGSTSSTGSGSLNPNVIAAAASGNIRASGSSKELNEHHQSEKAQKQSKVSSKKKKSKNKTKESLADGLTIVENPALSGPLESTVTVNTSSPTRSVPSSETRDRLNAKRLREWKPRFARHYGYLDLFRYANGQDLVLMLTGTLAALAAGLCIPAIIYCFGNLIRVQVLANKIETAFKCNESKCKDFQTIWKNATSDKKNFQEELFTLTPQPPYKNITAKHMLYFVEVELLITVTYAVLSSIYFFCWSYTSHSQGKKLRRAYFHSLLHKDMTWFTLQNDTELINRLMGNTRSIVDGIGENIPVAINLTVMFLACCILAFAHGWLLSLVSLVTIPLLVATTWVVSSAKAARILKERRYYRLAHDLSKEVLSKMRTVIGYGAQLAERALYKLELSRRNHVVIGAIFYQALSVSLLYLINFGVWAIVFWYGTALVLFSFKTSTDTTTYDEYDAGDMVIIIMSIIFGCGNVYIVAIVLKAMQVAVSCGREVFKVIDGPNGIDNISKEGFTPSQFLGKVEFSEVRFTYPGKKRGLILNNMNLTAKPQSLIGLVGLSESGKTTILRLICKEYFPDSGLIKIDDRDIRSLNTRWLRSNIGYVPQTVTLFDMTIEDNVRMGKLDASFFEIQEACKKAGAHDFIIGYKQGYQTKVGVNGSQLTPSQKQLLGIARALIRDPKLLLLDEPTYTLDSSTLSGFMTILQKICENRTVFYVAHRLHAIVRANTIYVIKNGKVVEQGDHKTLIKNKGPYTTLSTTDRPSKSRHVGPTLEGFDTSELSILSTAKTFEPKPILPNLYSNMITVDPAVCKVTHSILRNDQDTGSGYRTELSWTIQEGEVLPTLSYSDEHLHGSHELSVSEYGGRGRHAETIDGSVRQGKSEATQATDVGMKSASEDMLKDVKVEPESNPERSDWFQILKMGSSSSHVLLIVGSFSSICLAIGISLFGLFFVLIIDMLSDPLVQPHNWILARRLGNHNYTSWMISSIAILGLYTGVFAFLQDFCLNLAAFQIIQKLRRLVYGCMLKQDMSFFDDPENSSTKLASILFQDTDAIRHVTIGVYGTLLQSVVLFVVSVILCLVHAINLTFYTLLIVSLIIGVNLADGWLAKKQHGRTIKTLEQMSGLLLEVFRHKPIITACQMEEYFIQAFSRLQEKSIAHKKRISCLRIFTYGIAQSAILWGFGIIMWLGWDKMAYDEAHFIDILILSFVLLFGLVTLGTNLSVIMGFKHVVSKGGTRMLEIINRKPLLSPDEGYPIEENEYAGGFELVHTYFWKNHTPDITLLKGVNVFIPFKLNSVTAIVGSTESGKSAFLDLLARYYDPTGGFVTIGDKDMRQYSPTSLHKYISVLNKDPELFTNRTVAQNIALGDYSGQNAMDEIIAAAMEANVHNFIVSLPEGYETRIGGDHDYLSKAQKHGIAIARAILKNPKVLIIDDITSLLDKEGEIGVLGSIKQAQKNRTVIMISQRIQPVQSADRIIVMDNGYMEEEGTHQELLKKRPDGIYARMWRSQNPMEDENFLRGKVSYGSTKSKYKKPDTEILHPPKPPPLVEQPRPPVGAAQPPQPAEPEKEDDSGFCGGMFGYLGLGIIETEEEFWKNPTTK